MTLCSPLMQQRICIGQQKLAHGHLLLLARHNRTSQGTEITCKCKCKCIFSTNLNSFTLLLLTFFEMLFGIVVQELLQHNLLLKCAEGEQCQQCLYGHCMTILY